jgi:hypothetical protein
MSDARAILASLLYSVVLAPQSQVVIYSANTFYLF